MIENNFAIAGKTAIIYKIITKDRNTDSSICVQYKKNTDSTWTTIDVSANIDLNIQSPLLTEFVKDNDNIIAAVNVRLYTKSVYVAILGLSQGTQYNVRGYINGESFNEVTVTTMTGSKSIICTDITQTTDSSVGIPNLSDDDFVELKEKIQESLNYVYLAVNSITNISKSFKITLYFKQDGAFGDNRMYVNTNNLSKYPISELRNCLIHEISHNCFNPKYNNTYEIKKIMEFATDCENASWRWNNDHNYPVVSSHRYGFVDDMIVSYIMQLSGGVWKDGGSW